MITTIVKSKTTLTTTTSTIFLSKHFLGLKFCFTQTYLDPTSTTTTKTKQNQNNLVVSFHNIFFGSKIFGSKNTYGPKNFEDKIFLKR